MASQLFRVTPHHTPMDEDPVSRLPEISNDLSIGGVAVRHNHPKKTWPRLNVTTCLIDEPKDTDSKQRQEVWTFQQQHRGLVRSLLEALPDVPYRVTKPNPLDACKTETNDAEDMDLNLGQDQHSVRFPRVKRIAETVGQKNGYNNEKSHSFSSQGEQMVADRVRQRLRHRQELAEKNKPLPRKMLHKSITQRTDKLTSLNGRKNLSFSMNDISKLQNGENIRSDSASSSDSSVLSDSVLGNYGSSSIHMLIDAPKSVLDILSASQFGDSRALRVNGSKNRNVCKTIPEDLHDRELLQKFVGDKEVINMTSYENFARTRPLADISSSGNIPAPPKRLPAPLASSRGVEKRLSRGPSMISSDKMNNSVNSPPTSRAQGYQPVRVPPLDLKNNTNKMAKQIQPKDTLNLQDIPERPTNPEPTDTSRSSTCTLTPPSPYLAGAPIGERIAPLSPENSGRFFPVFTSAGSPIRKIGGSNRGKNRLQTLAPIKPS